MSELSGGYEVSRMRQMLAIGLAGTVGLVGAGCTPEQIKASLEYCRNEPDVEQCLGFIANLDPQSAYMDGGQVTDKDMVMDLAGIEESEQPATDAIVGQESGGWCATRWQGHHGDCPDDYIAKNESAEVGYGLPQATPPKKMAPFGPDWRRNPVTQMRFFKAYCEDRYGSILGALKHKREYGWY